MIRVLVFVALVFALALGAAWLADRPGEVAIVWQGYEIRSTLLVVAGAVALLSLLLALLWIGLKGLFALPGRIRRAHHERRRNRGLDALSRGMIAVGSGDRREAHRSAAEAGRLIGDMPLTRLLLAQEAQLAGDGARAMEHFRSMIGAEETRLLGLRGLYIEARRRGEVDAARQFAETAFATGKSPPWAGTALIEYQAAEHDWTAALATLAAEAKSGGIESDRAKHLRAVLLTAEALALEGGEPDRARTLALEAHHLSPTLVPAATAAARLLARASDYRRAARLLERTWKHVQHPEIAEAYGELRPADSVRDRLRRIERLNHLHPNSREGALALARAAIDARDWVLARSTLAPILANDPTERACLLMAGVENGEHADHGRVREYLARALRAPRDPAWVADGQVFPAWAPVSPVSGKLDAFEWKVPPQSAASRAAAELILANAPSASLVPAAEVNPPRPVATDEPLDLKPEPARPTPPPPPPSSPPPARTDLVVVPPQPDDPGPEPEDEMAPPRRFGLFSLF